MKTAFALVLVILAAGCTHVRRSDYKALDEGHTKLTHLWQAEDIKIPSVSFIDVPLARVAAAFYICNEDPPEFQPTITLATDDLNWSQQEVTLRLEGASLAKICDEICIQTGSVWRAN